MKRMKKYIAATLMMSTFFVGMISPLALAAPAGPAAIDPGASIQQGVNDSGGQGAKSLNVRLKDVVNVLLYIIGAVAVIMIVIGGLRYVFSGGESAAVTGAKNTILYAVIGIIVALLAYAIVNFVIGSFK